MITQSIATDYFVSKSKHMPALLPQRSLLSRFTHRQLIQDSETGMRIQYGVPDNQFVTTHSSTLFSDCFDPVLSCNMLAKQNTPAISSSEEDLRCNLIIDRNQPSFPSERGGDHTIMHQRLSKLLDITGSGDTSNDVLVHPQPDVLFMDEAEFNQQMTEYEANDTSNNDFQP